MTHEGGGMKIGSLFSGIGGLELGLERAGLGHVVWQVEIDPFCRRVLAKHWPDAIRFDDIRTVRGTHEIDCDLDLDCSCDPVRAPHADIICGGFPCQDVSNAGSRLGLDGERSGLWSEFARIVREIRPRFVVVENASALTLRGLDRVLGGLSESGYHAVWDCIPAVAVGAPFRRDRCFVVASTERTVIEALAESGRWRREIQRIAESAGFEGESRSESNRCAPHRGVVRAAGTGWWSREPAVARVAYGVSAGLDRARLTAHGNAVVPQVAEVVGRAIAAAIQEAA